MQIEYLKLEIDKKETKRNALKKRFSVRAPGISMALVPYHYYVTDKSDLGPYIRSGRDNVSWSFWHMRCPVDGEWITVFFDDIERKIIMPDPYYPKDFFMGPMHSCKHLKEVYWTPKGTRMVRFEKEGEQ